MKEKTLTDHLLEYLKAREGQWVRKVILYVVADEFGYSPETAGRYLRDLAEDKPYRKAEIKVGYYDGKFAKHLAQYSYNPKPEKIRKVVIEGGVAKEYFVYSKDEKKSSTEGVKAED